MHIAHTCMGHIWDSPPPGKTPAGTIHARYLSETISVRNRKELQVTSLCHSGGEAWQKIITLRGMVLNKIIENTLDLELIKCAFKKDSLQREVPSRCIFFNTPPPPPPPHPPSPTFMMFVPFTLNMNLYICFLFGQKWTRTCQIFVPPSIAFFQFIFLKKGVFQQAKN